MFPDPPETDNTLAIKDVIAQRVTAVRELQTNPNDFKAMKSIYESQKKVRDVLMMNQCSWLDWVSIKSTV